MGARGERLGELEQAGDGVGCPRRPRETRSEKSSAGEDAGVAVVGVALGVGAAGGLEVDPAHAAPADGEHGLGGRGRRRDVGLAIIRVTTTERTDDSAIASVEVEV